MKGFIPVVAVLTLAFAVSAASAGPLRGRHSAPAVMGNSFNNCPNGVCPNTAYSALPQAVPVVNANPGIAPKANNLPVLEKPKPVEAKPLPVLGAPSVAVAPAMPVTKHKPVLLGGLRCKIHHLLHAFGHRRGR